MTSNFFPPPLLLHPDRRKTELLSLSGIRHSAAAHDGFAPGEDHGIARRAKLSDPIGGFERYGDFSLLERAVHRTVVPITFGLAGDPNVSNFSWIMGKRK